MTSGFNISKDITRDIRFNEMSGFTEQELINLMESQEISKKDQEMLLPIMKENYDGYKFSMYAGNQMYNSNMCLYLLADYIRLKRMPDSLIDVNIASDYSKLGNMLNLCKGEERKRIIEDTVSGKGVISELTEKFNPEIGFGEKELVSMLFYLGYLTISEGIAGYPKLVVPNKVMKEIYADYFLRIINEQISLDLDNNYSKIALEIALEGGISKITELLGEYLSHLSNRDYQKFDEKYVKLIFYCIAMNLKIFSVKSEIEAQRKYPDLLLVPRDRTRDYCSVMIEFKYLKKGEKGNLEKMQQEAKSQIEEYSNYEDIKDIQRLRKYTVVAVVDEIYVEEIF